MNIHKFLANAVVLAGFVAVPFIPFIVLSQNTFFPFIVGKNFAFRLVVEIMFSAWIVLAFIDPAYRLKKTWLLGAFVAFLGIITLSAIFGENPTKSFWSNFERMEGVVTYFHLFAYFIVASTVLTVRDLWRPYLNFHLAVGVCMAIYAVLQWAGDLTIVQDGVRVNGTLGNAAYMGTYALFNVFLAGFFLVRESFTTIGERVRVAIYGSIVLLQTFVLYHTATRGAMLGLIAGIGLATLLVAIFERERKVVRGSAIGILAVVILFVGGFIAMRDAQFVKDSPVLSRFGSISLTETTTKSRFMVWNMAYQGFKERPVLGWGMENFNYVFNKYYDPKMYGQEQWFDRAHNVFFDWLIAGGLPALLAYISLFACAMYCIWRRADELSVVEKSVLTGLLGGYFFQNLFVFDNLTSLIYFGTILAYIVSISHRETGDERQKVEGRKTDGEDLTFMVSGGAIILAIVLVYFVNHNGFKQNTTLIRAMSERGSEGPAHNLALFKETIAYGSFGTSEAREQLGQLAMNGFDSSKGISEIQQQFLILAGEELEKQARELPNDARYQVFAGSFFSRVGIFDKGLAYLNKASELSPKKQTILFELGSAYYNKKDLANSEMAFKRAYELAPEYPEAKKFYSQILIANGKQNQLNELLK
ncbi:MAG: O-antigen ligase family protein [bacterium]|nr:O-antigen ligase family protein [bacterium]